MARTGGKNVPGRILNAAADDRFRYYIYSYKRNCSEGYVRISSTDKGS